MSLVQTDQNVGFWSLKSNFKLEKVATLTFSRSEIFSWSDSLNKEYQERKASIDDQKLFILS